MTNPSVRLAVFFDGTDNTPKDRTNVWRAHELMADTDKNGNPQIKCCIKGVGTDFGKLASGSIFGAGMKDKICEGYEWLAENYQENAAIYIFGFSRGAFAARSLIQMIACCGLPTKAHLKEWSAEKAFDRYDKITREETPHIYPIYRLRYWQRHPTEKPTGWIAAEEDELLLDKSKVQEVKVQMAGLWDTVAALGIDVLNKQTPSTQQAASHNVRPTKTQQYGYHAVAIDEHRPMFEVTLWRTFVAEGKQQATMDNYKKYYEQRWFVGAHSDVGGGYGEDDLPDLSLAWILEKASDLDLNFLSRIEPTPRALYAPIHDSFEAFAGGALSIWDKVIPGDQRHYREMGKQPRSVTTAKGKSGELWTINETIDSSVRQRWTEDPTYRPPSLVNYFRNNPSEMPQGTVLAQRTQRIYANRYWNETGVFVRPGVKYRINVVPGIGEPLRDASYLSPDIEGVEWDSVAHKSAALLHGKRQDDANWFALIGTIDKKHAWIIKPESEFTVPISGQLICYFNDVQMRVFYKNNSGWVVLEVSEKDIL